MAVLERGGNAFDAAVAAGVTLQVVEPHLNGPGRRPARRSSGLPGWGRPVVLSAQGVALADATIERMRALGHDLVPGTSQLAACVPGAFGGWLLVPAGLGTWRLEDVLAFAIGYAESGYAVVAGITFTIERVESLLREWPASAELYLPAPQPGTTFRNRLLAATWKRLLEGVARRFARGRDRARAGGCSTRASSREEIDAFSRENGGLLKGDDLRDVARDARGAGDVRLPRAHRLQDGAVGSGARGRYNSWRSCPGSTSRT